MQPAGTSALQFMKVLKLHREWNQRAAHTSTGRCLPSPQGSTTLCSCEAIQPEPSLSQPWRHNGRSRFGCAIQEQSLSFGNLPCLRRITHIWFDEDIIPRQLAPWFPALPPM
jgi:hypothetical protein